MNESTIVFITIALGILFSIPLLILAFKMLTFKGIIKIEDITDKCSSLIVNESELLPCPFCGHSVDMENKDTLYPSGWYWYEEQVDGLPKPFRFYILRDNDKFDGMQTECWEFNCPETSGGCGVSISGDSKEETIVKWQRRVVNNTNLGNI